MIRLLYKPSEATRAKWSEQRKGKNNPMYGVHRYGKDNPNYGKKHPGMSTGSRQYFKGYNNPNWKGGIVIDKSTGYVFAHRPEHHQSMPNGCVMYHRIVYESFHRCCLLPWAEIHHIDNNPRHNFPGNLIMLSKSEHCRLTHTGRKKTEETMARFGLLHPRDSITGRFSMAAVKVIVQKL